MDNIAMETQPLKTSSQQGVQINHTSNRTTRNTRLCFIVIFAMVASFTIGVLLGFFALPAVIQIAKGKPVSSENSNGNPALNEIAVTGQPQTTMQGVPLEHEELFFDVVQEENSVVSYRGSDVVPTSLHNHTQGFTLVRVQSDDQNERMCLYMPLVQETDFVRTLEYEKNGLLKLSTPEAISISVNLYKNPFRSIGDLGGPETMSFYVSEMCDLHSIYRAYPCSPYSKNYYVYSARIDDSSIEFAGGETGPGKLRKYLSQLSSQTLSVNIDLNLKVTEYHLRDNN